MGRSTALVRSILKGSTHLIVLSILLSVIQSASLLPVAALVNRVFDVHLASHDLRGLSLSLVAVTSLFLINGISQLANKRVSLVVIKEGIARLRSTLVEKTLSTSRMLISRKDRELEQSRIVQDTMRCDHFLSALLTQFIPGAIITVGLCFVLVSINPLLFLIFIVLAPLAAFLSLTVTRRFRRAVRAYHKSFSEFSKGISFILRFSELIHTSSAEPQEQERQNRLTGTLKESTMKASWLSSLLVVLQRQSILISSVVVLFAGGYFVIAGSNTVGELISFYVAVGLVSTYMRGALGSLPALLEGRESLETLSDILDADDEPVYSGTEVINSIDRITFKDIHFSYGNEDILKGISLSCAKGEKLNIKGPSGSGKTTLVFLLLGFYKPQAGSIEFNDTPITQLDAQALRNRIGVATQEPLLFSGTVRENLTYGLNREVPLQELSDACSQALIHEFILKLPEGYDNFIGEGGMLLSGGQRQRLSIARSLLRKPDLLILDEPENHLPRGMAEKIMNSIDMSSMIVLIISHMDTSDGHQTLSLEEVTSPHGP